MKKVRLENKFRLNPDKKAVFTGSKYEYTCAITQMKKAIKYLKQYSGIDADDQVSLKFKEQKQDLKAKILKKN